ncbi:hypothetical protein [Endozoicomonas sp.]|uniref:hypothetical protein n=1 Tax=Endozoicomonas sp. TaxID=1892382 RepID=UPI002885DB28|nr:hypothetical protein [Endozoicomonas sp.]
MNLIDLIQFFSHQDRQSFSLQGNFGTIHLTLESHDDTSTYQINCNYKSLTRHGWHYKTRQAGGFRLSTACCLAACVMFGEEQVTQGMIQKINKELET